MHLGIDQQSGQVYEGLGDPDSPAQPLPSVTLANLIAEEADWDRLPHDLDSAHTSWVFREDSFDAVSRIRRGRLYQPSGQERPSNHRVRVSGYDSRAGSQGLLACRLYKYHACAAILGIPHRGQGQTLVLGSLRASSAWLIIQTELLASGCVMVFSSGDPAGSRS